MVTAKMWCAEVQVRQVDVAEPWGIAARVEVRPAIEDPGVEGGWRDQLTGEPFTEVVTRYTADRPFAENQDGVVIESFAVYRLTEYLASRDAREIAEDLTRLYRRFERRANEAEKRNIRQGKTEGMKRAGL